MSKPEKGPVRGNDDPQRRGRKVWWWTAYLIGSVGIPFLMGIYNLTARGAPHFSVGLAIGGAFFLVLWFVMLPIGLALAFGDLIGACLQGQQHADAGRVELIALLLVPLAYYVFIKHLRLTLSASSRRVFLLLMLSLVLLITGSLVGCRQEINQPLGLQ